MPVTQGDAKRCAESYAWPVEHLRAEFLQKTRKLLKAATVEDFLEFLKVRDIAGGPATTQFYKAFPGGKGELLRTLREEALPAKAGSSMPVTSRTVGQLMQLVNDLKDHEEAALGELREIALEDFDGYFGPEADEVGDIFANLLAAARVGDEEAVEQLRDYYEALTDAYAGVYVGLLGAIGRRPIDGLGGVEGFAVVITALFDGLAIRARLGESAEEQLSASILPIVAALTVAENDEEPSDAERLYGAGERAHV